MCCNLKHHQYQKHHSMWIWLCIFICRHPSTFRIYWFTSCNYWSWKTKTISRGCRKINLFIKPQFSISEVSFALNSIFFTHFFDLQFSDKFLKLRFVNLLAVYPSKIINIRSIIQCEFDCGFSFVEIRVHSAFLDSLLAIIGVGKQKQFLEVVEK